MDHIVTYNGNIIGNTSVVIMPEPINIAYIRPQLTGQVTSYRTGDDGWNLANGVYGYTRPVDSKFVEFDLTQPRPFMWLKDNNIFGNKYRFTSSAGDQNYGAPNLVGYIIDHYTGLGWYRAPQLASKNWNDSIDLALASTLLGFSWRLPNVNEMMSIISWELSGGMDYDYGSTLWGVLANNVRAQTSTTYTPDTGFAKTVLQKSSQQTRNRDKTLADSFTNGYFVRNHFN